MYLYNSDQIKAWDKFTIDQDNIKSSELMERAGQRLYQRIDKLVLNKDLPIYIFCGLGNNGGDGLVIARHLRDNFYNVTVYECRVSNTESPDFIAMKSKLKDTSNILYKVIYNINEMPEITQGIIIDCLFGSGLNKPLAGLALEIVNKINDFRNLTVISVDVPSGMSIDKVENSVCVKADITLTIQNQKFSFLFEDSQLNIGEVHAVDIGLSPCFSFESDNILLTKELIQGLIEHRKKFSHKGNFGKALILSGDGSMLGATVIACKAMLKSGVGITYVATPIENRLLFNSTSPEVICIERNNINVDDYNSVGFGPGLGVSENSVNLVKEILAKQKPIVIDADALNIISSENLLHQIPKKSMLTPHPKEFDRLFGNHDSHFSRVETQRKISIEHGIYIILKTASTSISCPDGKIYFNATGNPGMAKGGSGDALTGLLTGLVARLKNYKSACLLAVYLHGLAGDVAKDKYSIESFTVSQLIDCIDDAWETIAY